MYYLKELVPFLMYYLEELDQRKNETNITILFNVKYFITNGADIGCSSKAVSFLPLLVKLVIEFGSFAVEDRG